MSGTYLLRGFPGGGGQLGGAIGGPIAQFGQHVSQIGAQVDD